MWLLPPLATLLAAELILILAFIEYSALAEGLGARISRMLAGTATAATCAALALSPASALTVLMAAVVTLGAVALGSGRTGPDTLHDVTANLFAPLYIGMPLGALAAIRVTPGREALLLLLLVVIVSDTSQYYSGRLFGRRRLAPAISPGKTVEGAIGGVVVGTAAMVLLGGYWIPTLHPVLRGLLGVTLVMLGIAGDLFESLLKRRAGVKDASSLIPGHGGVLDRIDALLFTAPMYYVLVRYGLGN